MPITREDINASEFYTLGGERDPRVPGQGLDAPRGATYALGVPGGTSIILQKQSAQGGDPTQWTQVSGGGGGGGSGAPVVLTDPVAPALDEQWILHTPGVPGLGISGNISGVPFLGQFLVNVASNNPVDLAFFAQNPTSWNILFQLAPYLPPNTFQVNPGPSPNGWNILFNPVGPVLTMLDLVNAMNIWSSLNLSIGGPIASLTNPNDNLIPLVGLPPAVQMPLISASTPESYVYKINGAEGIFTLPFVHP